MFEEFDSAKMIVGDLEGVSGGKNGNIECQFRNVDANEGLDGCCGHEKPSLQIRAGVKPPWRLFGFEATKRNPDADLCSPAVFEHPWAERSRIRGEINHNNKLIRRKEKKRPFSFRLMNDNGKRKRRPAALQQT